MKESSTGQTFLALIVIVCGFAAVFGLSRFVEASRPAPPEGFEDADLVLQGARLKGYALGFEGLLADWYWMKSLQYIGDKIVKSEKQISMDSMKELNPRLLYPYLDNATDLDPRFIEAYTYGALVLPAIDETQAIKIIKKGIANNPNEWRLYHQLGYIYWTLKDYERASEIYAEGANINNAPPFMQLMVGKLKGEGGSRETARAIYSQMLDQSKDEQIKETAALRLLEIDSLDEKDAIRSILQNFQAKSGRCANDWREIYPSLRTQKTSNGNALRFASATLAPLDPTGFAYVLRSETGSCDVSINFLESKIPAQ